jgi:hypothetical protein
LADAVRSASAFVAKNKLLVVAVGGLATAVVAAGFALTGLGVAFALMASPSPD